MRKSHFSEQQIISILQLAEAVITSILRLIAGDLPLGHPMLPPILIARQSAYWTRQAMQLQS
jgi:hypothetical protein